jgi:cytochrome P450
MRVMLTELLRTFDIVPIGRWSDREKNRRTMLVVRDPLRARVRRWSGS